MPSLKQPLCLLNFLPPVSEEAGLISRRHLWCHYVLKRSCAWSEDACGTAEDLPVRLRATDLDEQIVSRRLGK